MGNWAGSNYQEHLAGIDWHQATYRALNLDTIAPLVFYVGYYVRPIKGVLERKPLTARDKYSFNYPLIASSKDWGNGQQDFKTHVDQFVALIRELPESKLDEIFVDEKYGTYDRNLQRLVVHLHYHPGRSC